MLITLNDLDNRKMVFKYQSILESSLILFPWQFVDMYVVKANEFVVVFRKLINIVSLAILSLGSTSAESRLIRLSRGYLKSLQTVCVISSFRLTMDFGIIGNHNVLAL